jgi:hypothetical protein
MVIPGGSENHLCGLLHDQFKPEGRELSVHERSPLENFVIARRFRRLSGWGDLCGHVIRQKIEFN